jgi:DNA-binding GntR family transcriptional regulator
VPEPSHRRIEARRPWPNQLPDALHDLFTVEQRLILSVFGSRERDHEEHLAILDALEARGGRR